MKATLKRLISSSTTTIVLLLVYGAGLAIATFIEKYQGSEVARSVVYCSPLFFLLQFLIVLNWLAIVIRQRSLKMRKWGMLVTHGAFILILLGALVSHLYGEEGILHLREGETSNRFAVRHAGEVTYHTLPFSCLLYTSVRTAFYAGSDWSNGYPAATGIGMNMGGVLIDVDAAMFHTPDVFATPIDNKLQVAAHAYSEQVLEEARQKKTTPKFERAKSMTFRERRLVYISGTAAIRGEAVSYTHLRSLGSTKVVVIP